MWKPSGLPVKGTANCNQPQPIGGNIITAKRFLQAGARGPPASCAGSRLRPPAPALPQGPAGPEGFECTFLPLRLLLAALWLQLHQH